MKNLFSSLFVFVFTFSFAQNSQNLVDFNFVEVFDKIPVKLVKSDQNSAEISGAKAADVELVSKNNKLKIRMNKENLLKGEEVSVILHYKDLNEIHANEGAQISSDHSISTENLILNSKEGASINLNVAVNQLDIKTNSGGKITTNGTADFQSVVSNSGGNYDGQNLKTSTTEVTVNAGGDAKVFGSETVNDKKRAGGNIYIFGGAEVTQQTIAGGKIHIH